MKPRERLSADFEALRSLEESLWKPETRFDRAYLERVLAPDFFEFGRSGRVYTRADIMADPPAEIRCRFPLTDFAVHQISDSVVLVTYVSEVFDDGWQRANRSSLWRRSVEGWQLCFHQGTPCCEPAS